MRLKLSRTKLFLISPFLYITRRSLAFRTLPPPPPFPIPFPTKDKTAGLCQPSLILQY